MKINTLQQILLAQYQGGKFAHIKRTDDYRDCDDLIFKGLFEALDDQCILEANEKGISPFIIAARRLSNISAHVNALIPSLYTGVVPMSAQEPEHI